MDTAIKIAIEKGGYTDTIHSDEHRTQYHNRLVLDPNFWKALGKALGWTKHTFGQWKGEAWKVASIRYFTLLMDSGDTEAFWKELLE